MKIYGSYTSPYVRHCRIICADAGIEFQLVPTDHTESALGSHTKRVPYLEDGDINLFDSSSIVHYLRDKQGKAFLPSPHDTDLFTLANTILDTHINLLLLEKNGVPAKGNPYLERQLARVNDSMKKLEENADVYELNKINPDNDATIRVACMLEWVQFRNRDDLSSFPKLKSFYDTMYSWDLFKNTDPRLSST